MGENSIIYLLFNIILTSIEARKKRERISSSFSSMCSSCPPFVSRGWAFFKQIIP